MSLLRMSLSGAVLVVAIVVIRTLAINRLPKKTFLILWNVVLVRLLVPYSLPSTLSVYSLMERFAPAAPENTPGNVPAVPMAGVPVAPVSSMSDAPLLSMDPWTAVWLVGAGVCALYFIVAYLKWHREFQASLPVENDYARTWLKEHRIRRTIEIRQSDRITAPLTYGMLRPVILMPKATEWNDRVKYVLAHEYVHISRFDAVTKLALTAALCVHWFNPLVWIMYILANRDIELSCDEAVIRLFGEHEKTSYALTLIRMEEAQSRSAPLCNNFGKTAIEERMIAIMKTKKTSLPALAAAVAVVVGVTTAFATTGQSPEEREKGGAADIAQTTMTAQIATSYINDADGITASSVDAAEGVIYSGMDEAPITMGDGEVLDAFALDDVEWWTAEEYAAWLEQEKMALQSVIGSQGWTRGQGWFTWTQELVDETIAQYEQTLENIRAGLKVSKPTGDGDTMIQFGYDPALEASETDTATVFVTTEALGSASENPSGESLGLTAELLADYWAYGLTYDEAMETFRFNGKPVRYFFDGYNLENGVATIYDYVNKEGDVDVYTVRQAVRNPDGSTDPAGRLVGIEECSQEEYDRRVMMEPQTIQETAVTGFTGGVAGKTFEELFDKYKEFGVTYVEAPNASGKGNVYINGQLVGRFSDVSPDGGVFSFTSASKGDISVQTVYDDNGRLAGVRTIGK